MPGYPTDDAMGEASDTHVYREIDQRVIALARTLTDRDLNVWIEMGEVLARTQDEP